jgi:hypothetical protein
VSLHLSAVRICVKHLSLPVHQNLNHHRQHAAYVFVPRSGLRAPGERLLLHGECRRNDRCIGPDSRMRGTYSIALEKELANFSTAAMYHNKFTEDWLRPSRHRVPVHFQELDKDLATMLGTHVHLR